MISVQIEIIYQKEWFNLNLNKMGFQNNASEDKKKQILWTIERIEKLNAIIDVHQQNEEDNFMIRQYEYRKSGHLKELQLLLEELNIKVDLKLAA